MRVCSLLFVFLLITAMVVGVTGCQPAPHTTEPTKQTIVQTKPTTVPDESTIIPTEMKNIDWDMFGVWITSQGTEISKVRLAITGSIPIVAEAKAQDVELNIVWPDNFRFENEGVKIYSGYPNMSQNEEIPYKLFLASYTHNPITGEACFLTFVICPEQEFAVMKWEDDEDKYLVVSTDPNADYLALLNEYLQLTS